LSPDPEFGLGTTDQRAPFHRSIRVLSVFPAIRKPTAHASLAESAETALSSLLDVPEFGLRTARHEVPSKCSIRVLNALEEGPRNVPAAHTSVLERAEIADNWLKSLLRFGVDWMVQTLASPAASAKSANTPTTASPDRRIERMLVLLTDLGATFTGVEVR
jgi:hypothetical protein